MELAEVLLGLAVIGIILATPIVALIALARTSKQVEELYPRFSEELKSWM